MLSGDLLQTLLLFGNLWIKRSVRTRNRRLTIIPTKQSLHSWRYKSNQYHQHSHIYLTSKPDTLSTRMLLMNELVASHFKDSWTDHQTYQMRVKTSYASRRLVQFHLVRMLRRRIGLIAYTSLTGRESIYRPYRSLHPLMDFKPFWGACETNAISIIIT